MEDQRVGRKLPWAKMTHGIPKGSQKLPWAKIDPRKTKNYRGLKMTHRRTKGWSKNRAGLKVPTEDQRETKNYRGPKLTHGRPKGSLKFPWAKIVPWKTKGLVEISWSNKVTTSKRAKPLKEDQKLPWAKIAHGRKKLGGRKIGGAIRTMEASPPSGAP